jgi:peptide/nickel transport system ATP-binding protein
VEFGASPVLEVRGLTVSYSTARGDLRALRDVSLAVRAGETLALVGESGSGKSTVALAVMGLLGREATSQADAVRFRDQDLVRLSAEARRRLRGNRMAMVFQDPFSSLNPSLPIGVQVGEPLVFHRAMTASDAHDKAIVALADVGLRNPAEVARSYPHQLSGGMQQRALIATALICDPDLLILDEPTTALDVTVEAEILDLLDDVRRRRSLSMLFITHNLGLVNRICDSVCVLYAGSVLEYGPASDLLRQPAHPYAAGLLRSMPRLDPASRRQRLVPIAGRFPDLTSLPSGCVFHPRCAHAEEACQTTPQTLEIVAPAHLVRCWKWHAAHSVDDSLHDAAAPRRALPEGTPLVDAREIRKTYTGGTRLKLVRSGSGDSGIRWPRMVRQEINALRGVSLAIAAGEDARPGRRRAGAVNRRSDESPCDSLTLSGGSLLFRSGRDLTTADGRRAIIAFAETRRSCSRIRFLPQTHGRR